MCHSNIHSKKAIVGGAPAQEDKQIKRQPWPWRLESPMHDRKRRNSQCEGSEVGSCLVGVGSTQNKPESSKKSCKEESNRMEWCQRDSRDSKY